MIRNDLENDRFAQALSDELLRRRLIVEYAQKSRRCGWAAVVQAGIAVVMFLVPGAQKGQYVFLCVALGFILLSFRLRRDLKRLRLAGESQPAGLPIG